MRATRTATPLAARGGWLIAPLVLAALAACETQPREEAAAEEQPAPAAETGPMPAETLPTAAGPTEVPDAAVHTTGAQLVGAFTQDSPFDPDAPEHLWFDNGDGTLLFLHYDKPLPQAAKVIYTGYGVKGRWCAEDQPEGFTHFHRTAKVGAWDAGHGGSKPGEEGYWLKHIAVEKFDMPAMMGMPARTIEPGLDRQFMPTRAPNCRA